MKIQMPVEVLMSQVVEVVQAGGEATIRAKGRSMMPSVRDGKDSIVIRAIDPNNLAVGDFVLAFATDKRYVAHRIVDIDSATGLITLKGDGNLYGTETCTPSGVIGIVTHIERNGRRIDCNTPSERRKAALGSKLYLAYLWTRHQGGNVLRALGLRRR